MNKNTLGKNAVLNGIKTACSILFPFISFSYCSRILGANGLGAYSFGQSIISYLLLVAALGIPNYAIREGAYLRKRKDELNEFIAQVFTINCLMTIIAYGVMLLLFWGWTKLENYKYIVIIQSIQIILTTLGADWINSIFEDYLYLAVRYIIIQIISLVALVLFVKSPSDIYIYTFITVMSNAGGNILNWGYIRKRGVKLSFYFGTKLIKHMAPIFILFSNSIASTIYLNSDITMLGIFGSDSAVGIYTVASKIYSMIKSLLVSVIMVVLPRFSAYVSENRQEEYNATLNLVQDVLMIFMLPVSIGLFLEADKILNLVAGSEYAGGVAVVKILAIAIPFAIEACFFSYSILMPNRKERYFLVSTVIAAMLNIFLNLILLPYYGMYAAAFTTLLAEIAIVLITIYYSRKIIRPSINKRLMLQVVTGCVGVVLACKIVDRLCLTDNVKLLMDIVISVIVYLVFLMMLKCETVKNLISKIRKER